MSNLEKMKVDDTLEPKDDYDEQWSDEELAIREVVVGGLPALRISTESIGVRSVEGVRLNQQAAELVMAAAEEAVMKEKTDGKKKKVRRQRKTMRINDEAGGSGESRKPKKKALELTNPPKGPPVCNICGRRFGSWNAVFGHLRSHKDRKYQRFLPPLKFSAVAGKVVIPGPNSAFVLVSAGGGSSSVGRGVGNDLNVNQVEKDVEELMTKSGSIAKFDLNKSPQHEEEEK